MERTVALITGGTSGIGFAIAEKFAQHGIDLILVSSTDDKLELAASRLSSYPVSITKIQGNLSNSDNIPEIIKRIQSVTNKLDIFVNNAGKAQFASVEDYSSKDFDTLFDFNVKVPFLLIQALVPLLRVNRGCIVNISTYWAHKMIRGRYSSLYSASRGAMASMVKALANELCADGIRVNAVAPGSTQSETLINWKTSLSNTALGAFENEIQNGYPLARLGEPQEIADAIFFLASNQASWITGQTLNVDGGFTVR